MSTSDEASAAIDSISAANAIATTTTSTSTMVKPQEELVVESPDDAVTSPSHEEDLDDDETTTEEPEEDGEEKTTEEQEEWKHQLATKEEEEESAQSPLQIPLDDEHLGEASLLYQDQDTTANNHLYEYEDNPYATTTQGTSSIRPTAQEFQDLGYEDAAPTPRRGSMFGDAAATGGSRRDSLVERMINWAGQVGSTTGITTRRATGEGGGGGRRGSVDFMGGIPVVATPSPKFRAPSIGNEEVLFDDQGNPIPQSAARIKGHGSRRNSLQDMLDKAMAFVNLRPNFHQGAEDELSPFGTRRDSLFNTS